MGQVDIVVDFFRPAFHGLDSRGRSEWPIAPWRLLGALLAGCHGPRLDAAARAAVEALSRLDAPVIFAPLQTLAKVPDTFTHRSGTPGVNAAGMVTAGGLAGFVDLSRAGMTAKNRVAKPMGAVVLAGRRVVFRVADPDRVLDVVALDRAAARVPYLGRSHDSCDVFVAPAADDHVDRLQRWTPELVPGSSIRGWSPRSVEWLDRAHAHHRAGHLFPMESTYRFSTALRYRTFHDRPAGLAAEHDSDVSVVPLGRSRRGGSAPRLWAQFGAAWVNQLGVFPVVNAGHERGDGRLLGVGVRSGDPQILADARAHIDAAAPGAIDLEIGGAMRRPRPWVDPAQRWVSATPLRAFPDEYVANRVICAELQDAFGVSVGVTLFRHPAAPWQHRWANPGDGLGLWWAQLAFAEPVAGPMQCGASTALGFGLFVRQEA